MGVICKDTEWFKMKVKEYHKDKVEVIGEYKGSLNPIDIVYHCKDHGDTYATLNAKNICKEFFLPCKKCQSYNKSESAKKSKKDKDYFYKRLQDYCKSKGGIVLTSEWTKAKDIYEFKCGNPDHPTFKTSADALYSGNHWCPYCSGRSGNFEENLRKIIHNKNGELLSKYTKATIPLKVKCNKHNYIWNVLPNNINKGKWCPICNLPYTEEVVWDYFKNNNINVEIQYKFNDLVGKNNEKLKFDFAIFDNGGKLFYLVESDDVEHRHNHDNCERRQIARERDIMKNEYCKKNNINLYRMEVPFTTGLNNRWAYDRYYKYIEKELGFIKDLLK